MSSRSRGTFVRAGRGGLTLGALCVLAGAAVAPAAAQQAGQEQEEPARPGVRLGRILGDVPMTAADSMVQTIVERIDMDSFKDLVRQLSEFGDREQGTPGNAAANDWIEATLQGWGYETERVGYTYQPREGPAGPRDQVIATKVGSTIPEEMYIVGAHMDGRGGGQATNDNASGTALVLEMARILAAPDIETERSIRFALWNNEETGLNGARAYVEQRAHLQGIESPAGSGRYPEPRWVGMIQHDQIMWDHGNPVTMEQAVGADINVEYQMASGMMEGSSELGVAILNANRMFATDYPATLSNAMSNTDSTPFMDLVPSVSIRDNPRLYGMGNGTSPHWHQPTDLFVSYSDLDFLLGYNTIQTTLGAVAKLAGVRIVPRM